MKIKDYGKEEIIGKKIAKQYDRKGKKDRWKRE